MIFFFGSRLARLPSFPLLELWAGLRTTPPCYPPGRLFRQGYRPEAEVLPVLGRLRIFQSAYGVVYVCMYMFARYIGR